MKKILFLAIALGLSMPAFAQTDSTVVADGGKVLTDEVIEQYRRSSLYTVLLAHPEREFGATIDSVFMMMETPDKFNNHDIWPKSLVSSSEKAKKVKANIRGTEKDPNIADITAFMNSNHVARELVAKWFNRDSETGYFNLDLISERGFYDASFTDIENADANLRGRAMLADAGFDLINKTFMIVNDITFIDHGENSAKASAGIKAGLSILGALASAVTGDDSMQALGDSAGELIGGIANEVAGYKVNIITYLYRLDWNEEILNQFLAEYWLDESAPDAAKKAAFDASDLFTMSYVGHASTSAENVSSKTFSLRPRSEQFLRVCTRAVDKAIVELQREYDEFKVNVPIHEINEDGTVSVKIGLKEGVNKKSRYEVLMKDASSGVIEYKKVGMLAPIEDKIWDNRFGAQEEAEMKKADQELAAAEGAEAAPAKKEKGEEAAEEGGNPFLGATVFKVIEGQRNIMPGLLIREAKIANVKSK